jgi:hypothetical protein
MTISQELDRSIGEGPPLPPPQELLPPGRRALARRRLAIGAVGVAAAVLVAGAAATGTGLVGGAQSPAPAGPPSGEVTDGGAAPTAESSAAPPTRSEIQRVLSGAPVKYDDRGRVVITPTAHVLQRIDNPFGLDEPRRSVAVAAEIDGAEYWFAYYYDADGSSGGISGYSGDYKVGFETWAARQSGVADNTEAEWPGIPGLDLVRFAEGDRLEPVGGVTLVRQVAQPDLGPAWAGPDDRSAVAEVLHEGERYYVLARALDGKPQFIAVPEADGGPTLEEFLALARDRYAEGGGGLL